MTILTEYDIQLRGTAIVRNGNLCSRRGNINIGPGKVKIPQDRSSTSDVIAATGTITVTGNAKVAHCRGTVVGTCDIIDPPIPCPDDPPFPSFTASADPADDIYCVKTGGGTTIAPGTYRDLIVNIPGAKCKFDGPGDYNFRRIIGKSKGIYTFENAPDPCDLNRPFNINVKEFMYVAEFSKFNKASVVPSFIHVEGADGYYDSNNTSPDGLDGLGPSAFFYQGDGAFCVCKVFAPNGTISIRGHLKTSCSQWVGKHFQQVDKLKINLGLPFEPECCIQVIPGLACTKKFDKSLVDLGDEITATVVITNTGDVATHVKVTDVLDNGLVFKEMVAGYPEPNPNPPVGQTVIWPDIGNLNPGESLTLMYVITVAATSQGESLCNDVTAEAIQLVGIVTNCRACVHIVAKVPTFTQWGMIGFSLVLGVIAVWSMRRRSSVS
jgi:uncharacterized repeat protein (TIGR01451 family)